MRGLVYQIGSAIYDKMILMENSKTKESNLDPLNNLNEEITLYEWTAAERAFQKKDKDFWITSIAILVLVSVILIFIKEFFLIIALGSLLFLFYVLSTVPPGEIKYRITNRGIYLGDTQYFWDIFEKFWFKPNLSSEMIHLGTVLRFPRVVSLVMKANDKEKLKEIFIKKIPMIESAPSFIDKLTAWAAEKLPLEKREVDTVKKR